MSTDLSDEGRHPDDDEDDTAIKLSEDVEWQVEPARTQLVTENHHDERVEQKRVVDSRHSSHSRRTTRLHAYQPVSWTTASDTRTESVPWLGLPTASG